jgi:hypothetical protein
MLGVACCMLHAAYWVLQALHVARADCLEAVFVDRIELDVSGS